MGCTSDKILETLRWQVGKKRGKNEELSGKKEEAIEEMARGKGLSSGATFSTNGYR